MPFITRVDPHVEASATSNAESHGIEDPWLVGKTERIKHERMILPTVSSRFYPFLIRLRNRMCTLLLAAARLWRSPFACVQFAWRSAMRMRIKTRAGCKSSKVCRGIAHARGFRFVIIDPVASDIHLFILSINRSIPRHVLPANLRILTSVPRGANRYSILPSWLISFATNVCEYARAWEASRRFAGHRRPGPGVAILIDSPPPHFLTMLTYAAVSPCQLETHAASSSYRAISPMTSDDGLLTTLAGIPMYPPCFSLLPFLYVRPLRSSLHRAARNIAL